MGLQQIGEIVGQLLFRQIVDLMIIIGADAADGAGIGLDGFGLQILELKVLEKRLVVLLEIRLG